MHEMFTLASHHRLQRSEQTGLEGTNRRRWKEPRTSLQMGLDQTVSEYHVLKSSNASLGTTSTLVPRTASFLRSKIVEVW
jgi:hypothetical protein